MDGNRAIIKETCHINQNVCCEKGRLVTVFARGQKGSRHISQSGGAFKVLCQWLALKSAEDPPEDADAQFKAGRVLRTRRGCESQYFCKIYSFTY